MSENTDPIYLCSSADWQCVIKTAKTPEEAASHALQRQVDSESSVFAVAAAICVVPITIHDEHTSLIYAPSVLADIGMHKYAKQLSIQIKKDEGKN